MSDAHVNPCLDEEENRTTDDTNLKRTQKEDREMQKACANHKSLYIDCPSTLA